LNNLTLNEVAQKLNKKEISSKELTENILNKIAETDSQIGGYLEVFKEDALKKAMQVDELRAKGGDSLSYYAGIPIAIKDNMNILGKQMTCASKILKGYVAPYNATVIEKLNAHNLVLLGRLNMDEFAMGSSTENSAFQKTRNPWDVERVPGGSSGGSAAAVASNQAFAALGSDTGGSIRQPASFCGVVGFKPTYGMVSRYGLAAFASSLDQIGPLSKDVKDAAIIFDMIKGFDRKDSTSVEFDKASYANALGSENLKGKKFAIPEGVLENGVEQGVKESFQNIVKKLEEAGAIVESVKFPSFEYALSVYYLVATAEASANLSRFDGVRYGFRADASENVFEMYGKTRSEGFGDEVKRRIMLGTYVLSSGYYDAYYIKAQKVRTLIKNDYDVILKDYDAVISPTSPTTAFKFGEKMDDPLTMYLSDIMTIPVNLAGLPSISIPIGLSDGLPVGFQITANSFEDRKLLDIATNIEQLAEFKRRKV